MQSNLKMKRVGLVCNNLLGGGAEKVVLHLARMFQKKDIDVHIFLLDDRISYDVAGLNIHILGKKRKKNKLFMSNNKKNLSILLEKTIQTVEEDGVKFDLLLSNLPVTDKIVSMINVENSIYYIIHTSYFVEIEEFKKKGQLWRAVRRKLRYKKLYNNKDIICVSQGIYDDIEKLGIKCNSNRVIYNPFNFNVIQEQGIEVPVYSSNENYIVHVGAFRKEKRHDILLEAYAKLINPPQLKLFCDYNDDLQKMIEGLKLEDKVEIFGFHKNPYPYIKNAKMLILSSEREGLPTVIIEALILNTPVVSTDCISGPSEIY